SGSAATDGTSTAVINGNSFSGTIGTVSVTTTAGTASCSSPSWSTSQISCSFPAGSGLAAIVVTIGGQSSSPFNVVYAAPTISGLNPAAGVSTAGGSTLVITGTHFGTSQPSGAYVVIALATGPTPCSSYPAWSDTSISCVVPAGNGT